MSESKHTPGPWICYADLPSREPNWHIITTANKMRVLANVHIEPGNETDEANAALMVAAPDMSEAIDRFLKAYGPDRSYMEMGANVVELGAALAKANSRGMLGSSKKENASCND